MQDHKGDLKHFYFGEDLSADAPTAEAVKSVVWT